MSGLATDGAGDRKQGWGLMQAVGWPALILGLIATFLLLGHYGFDAVAATLLNIGWPGFLAIVLLHLVVVALCGVAWFLLVPPTYRPAPSTFVWGRFVRNSATDLLPLSQVGGAILGTGIAVRAGLSKSLSAASLAVDLTMEFLAQLAFAGLALAIFMRLRPGSPLATSMAAGLALAGLVGVLWLAAQCRDWGLSRLSGFPAQRWIRIAVAAATSLQLSAKEIYRRPWRVGLSFLLHLFCWILGATEAWLALRFMHQPLGFSQVLAIEGLLSAGRAVAFAVPAAVGVQESLYITLGGLFGLAPATALALSLLKRARDLAIGLPPLAIWQLMEGRRLWSRRPAPSAIRIGQESPGRAAEVPAGNDS